VPGALIPDLGGMRCGWIPFTSRIWWVRSIRLRRTAAVDGRAVERRAHHLAEPGSGGLGENVLLLNQIQQDDSFTQSANLVTGQLQVADSALGSVVSQLTQAISLATSANNGTMNSSNVKSIANQISGILNEVTRWPTPVIRASTSLPAARLPRRPFTTSTATSPATTTYNGDENVNYLQRPTGRRSS
jgi:hypothetical protein